MTLPSSIGGRTTETCGFFDVDIDSLASWLHGALGDEWRRRPSDGAVFDEVLAELEPGGRWDRMVLVPLRDWTLMLTNGPLGTDLGVIPSWAARDLGVRAIRAVAVEPGADRYAAVILEVFDPEATDSKLRSRRSIYEADDGGTPARGDRGEPFPFEEPRPDDAPRGTWFTPTMLHEYLGHLGVPGTEELDLGNAEYIERTPR